MRKECKESPAPFTWDAYELSLRAALESGYRFLTFPQVGGTVPDGPFVLLRHDIDYDPRWALPISTLEAEHGVRATYFFQVDSKFYSLQKRENRSVIEQVLSRGHAMGLHFDATGIEEDEEVLVRVEKLAEGFEREFQAPVEAVSFHMPTYRPVTHLKLKNGRINTYAPMFFETIDYVSDSNQDWRNKDLLEILRNRKFQRLQVLTHPIWWRKDYSSLGFKMQQLALQLGMALEDILTAEQQALLGRAQAGVQ
jgi:hypothetical protein